MDIHNLTKDESEAARRQHFRVDFPYSYGISLGEWQCNRLCRMCPMFNAPPKEQRYITDEIYERACMEVGDREISLEISAYGETFQHPQADKYLFTTRRLCQRASIVIATNGTLLDRERCEKIADSGIDHLSFSLDAGSPETYKWLTGSNDYGRVVRNLETLVETRNRRGAKHLRITTHIIGIKELSQEFETFLNRWRGVVDHAYVRNYGNWAGLVDSNSVTPAEEQRIPDERYPCAWLWYATKVEFNGDISKCFIHITGDSNPLGNIMKESFESIWRGERIRRLREQHCKNEYNDIEFCGACMVWSLFPNFWEKKNKFNFLPTKEWR